MRWLVLVVFLISYARAEERDLAHEMGALLIGLGGRGRPDEDGSYGAGLRGGLDVVQLEQQRVRFALLQRGEFLAEELEVDREGHGLGLQLNRRNRQLDDQLLGEFPRRPGWTTESLTPDEAVRAVISYEPVWAIGTGRAATPQQAQEVQSFIRKRVAFSHGEAPAAAMRILYGGSVKPDNIAALMDEGDIDGAPVGGARLDPDSYLKIIRHAGA